VIEKDHLIQNGFMKGGSIFDGVQTIQGLLELAKLTDSPKFKIEAWFVYF